MNTVDLLTDDFMEEIERLYELAQNGQATDEELEWLDEMSMVLNSVAF